MLHVGLDLSRRRLDYCVLGGDGERVEMGAVAPDADVLAGLVRAIELRHGRRLVRAAIESMNGARFVHDVLERCGWDVQIADALGGGLGLRVLCAQRGPFPARAPRRDLRSALRAWLRSRRGGQAVSVPDLTQNIGVRPAVGGGR
jgi:hypothetical protein